MTHRRPKSKLLSALLASLTSLVFCATIVFAQPSFADWEGSKAEDNLAKAVDATLIRPLALLRVVIGAAFLVPTALLSSPGGRESLSTAYDVLLAAPMEYAFDRELGDF